MTICTHAVTPPRARSGGRAEVEGGQQAPVCLGHLADDALPEGGFRPGELKRAVAPGAAHGAVDALPDHRIPDQAANVDLGQVARRVEQNDAARHMRVGGQADKMIEVHPVPVAKPGYAKPAASSTGNGTGPVRNWLARTTSRTTAPAAAAPNACAIRQARCQSWSTIGLAGE